MKKSKFTEEQIAFDGIRHLILFEESSSFDKYAQIFGITNPIPEKVPTLKIFALIRFNLNGQSLCCYLPSFFSLGAILRSGSWSGQRKAFVNASNSATTSGFWSATLRVSPISDSRS
jgi:hypothetical protein